MTLDELNLEEPARVSEVGGQGALRIHLRGYELTLRIEDAKKIQVEKERLK